MKLFIKIRGSKKLLQISAKARKKVSVDYSTGKSIRYLRVGKREEMQNSIQRLHVFIPKTRRLFLQRWVYARRKRNQQRVTSCRRADDACALRR